MRSLALVLSVLPSVSYCQGYYLELVLSWPFFKLWLYYLPELKFNSAAVANTRLLHFVGKPAINVSV